MQTETDETCQSDSSVSCTDYLVCCIIWNENEDTRREELALGVSEKTVELLRVLTCDFHTDIACLDVARLNGKRGSPPDRCQAEAVARQDDARRIEMPAAARQQARMDAVRRLVVHRVE